MICAGYFDTFSDIQNKNYIDNDSFKSISMQMNENKEQPSSKLLPFILLHLLFLLPLLHSFDFFLFIILLPPLSLLLSLPPALDFFRSYFGE